jgi:hypothetical protein
LAAIGGRRRNFGRRFAIVAGALPRQRRDAIAGNRYGARNRRAGARWSQRAGFGVLLDTDACRTTRQNDIASALPSSPERRIGLVPVRVSGKRLDEPGGVRIGTVAGRPPELFGAVEFVGNQCGDAPRTGRSEAMLALDD